MEKKYSTTTSSTGTGGTKTSTGGAGATAGDTSTAPQAATQLNTALASADANVTQGVQSLGLVHQARLSRATRTAAALTAKYGATDPRVLAVQSSITATNATISRVAMLGQQLAVPAVQVAKTGWALQGYVFITLAQANAPLQPAAKFTVFLVDAHKLFLDCYGFAYTDSTGYFLINYAGETGRKAAATAAQQLFIEVADAGANPVYLSSSAFQPLLGAASNQTIVLPVGAPPIGDPPAAIRAVALPGKGDQCPPAASESKES